MPRLLRGKTARQDKNLRFLTPISGERYGGGAAGLRRRCGKDRSVRPIRYNPRPRSDTGM
jgi:hypothetical protein